MADANVVLDDRREAVAGDVDNGAVLDVATRADADEVRIMPEPAPISTRPISTAFGAMKASGAIFGSASSSA